MKNFDRYITCIEEKIKYTFRDKSLLRQAFTRASFCNEAKKNSSLQSNEVLEFFGDSVLSAAIVTFLIKNRAERYQYGIKTALDEGDFSNIRSKLSDKRNLSRNMARLGLEKYLIMGEGDAKLGIEKEFSVMEDLFESIVGAIYIDSNYNISSVMASVEAMLDITDFLSGENSAPKKNAKNSLQEYCADKKRRLPPPQYKKIGEEGPDHDKLYTVICIVDGNELGKGVARSIKAAECAAAEAALKSLGIS